MIPIFTKLFAISMDARRVFGVSSRVTILLKEGCCLVFSILRSLIVSEKKATSEPATKKEIKNRMIIVKRSMVVCAGEIARIVIICFPNKSAE
jgi:hypothetical protein